jgi:streptomycin 6-kinase
MTENPLALPDDFINTITGSFGERGGAWLELLPNLLSETAERWSLTVQPAFRNLSFNYVAPVVRADGTEAVLKAGVPHKELWTEIAALRLYRGRGIVRLLEADSDTGVFLLERLKPGVVLTTLADEAHDDAATSIAASVMRGLWCPVPPDHGFPTVHDWAQGMERLRHRFDGGVGPFPRDLVEKAEALFAELLGSMTELVLLHGDLHHDNILSAEREPWLAIDPKGIVGEPAYETGALLRNLWEDRHTISNPTRMTERRIHILAEELDLDRRRIRDWSVAQSMLSAWWCLEDNMDCWASAIEMTQRLAEIRV